MPDAILADVVIVHPHDRRLARLDWQTSDAGFEQSEPFETEPVFLVVPKHSTDRALARLVDRFGVRFEDLVEFRERPYPATMFFQVRGRGMEPRFRRGDGIALRPLAVHDALHVDLEVLVRLKSGECLLRQINAWNETQIEVVDCWRADRVTIDREQIESLDRVLGPREVLDGELEQGFIGQATADVPGWLRHRQIGRQFIGQDRSRDSW